MTLIRPAWSDEKVAIAIALYAGGFAAVLAMGRERGLSVERLAQLTRLTPETVTAVLNDWPVDAARAARTLR